MNCNYVVGTYCESCSERFKCYTGKSVLKPFLKWGNNTDRKEEIVGDVFTLERFVWHCTMGMFMDSDGNGLYSNGVEQSNIEARPSDIKVGKIDHNWSHVIWFNK